MNFKRLGAICLAALALTALLCCAGGETAALDYADPANWLYCGEGEGKTADVFLIAPTVDMGRAGNMNLRMDDETALTNFAGAVNMERAIYDDALALYAPFYRQVTFPVFDMPEDEAAPYMRLAYADVRAAFLNYLSRVPQDRPFVLAGFSQGSALALCLLKELFGDRAYQDRLIAAYLIGWRVTDEDLAACPWLAPAQGRDDTGVFICFTAEAEGVEDSQIVPAGMKTRSINLLNWKTDGTRAGKDENLGACFTDSDGAITKEIPALTGAYLDAVRGTLKAPDIDCKEYANNIFPDGVYHLYDYLFFFRNLQANVLDRVAAYENARGTEK